MEDTGKKGLGQKLKEKLHLGHSSKSSNASDDSGYASQGQGPLGSSATTGNVNNTNQGYTGSKAGLGSQVSGPHSASGAGSTAGTPRSEVSSVAGNTGRQTGTVSDRSLGGTGGNNEVQTTRTSGSHGLEDSRSRKHVEADSVERGYNESFSVGPEFNRAAEFARKAAEESASANAFSKEAYKRAEEATYYRKEAEDAEARLTDARSKLVATQANIPNVTVVQQQTQMAESMVSRNAALAEESIRAAEVTAAEARRKYEAAKLAADEAERARLAAESLAQEAQSRKAGLEGADQAAARLRENARTMHERAAEAKTRLQSIHVELVDAQHIAEERARELAVANSLVAEKTREYAELQRFVTESEQTAAGMDEKFKLQMLETRQERESLAEIERRLLAAEAAAQQAKDAVVGQADVAKLERERALAARAEAEQANKNLDSARHLAAMKQRELENAKLTAEEMEAQLAPLRNTVAEYETTQKTKYASAETSAREWAEVTAKADMHKGKWSEYWEQAKIAGDMGNEKANTHYEEMREKTEDAVPDRIKDMVKHHETDVSAQHSSKATAQDYDAATETGPNANIPKVEGVYEGGRSENQGSNLLDRTKQSAENRIGGHSTQGQIGSQGQTGSTMQNRGAQGGY